MATGAFLFFSVPWKPYLHFRPVIPQRLFSDFIGAMENRTFIIRPALPQMLFYFIRYNGKPHFHFLPGTSPETYFILFGACKTAPSFSSGNSIMAYFILFAAMEKRTFIIRPAIPQRHILFYSAPWKTAPSLSARDFPKGGFIFIAAMENRTSNFCPGLPRKRYSGFFGAIPEFTPEKPHFYFLPELPAKKVFFFHRA